MPNAGGQLGTADYVTATRYCLSGGESTFISTDVKFREAIPTNEQQSVLFNALLNEFFKIEDLSERLERTSDLLKRFTGWFDLAEVLDRIPNDWSVHLVSGFLVHAFRNLIMEKDNMVIAKALCSAQNLKKGSEVVEKVKSIRPTVKRHVVSND